MRSVLIHLRPLDPSTNARVDVRVGDCASSDDYGLLGQQWEPAIGRRPTLTMELMGPEIDGRVQVGKAKFEVLLAEIKTVASPQTLVFKGAPVTILLAEAEQDLGDTPEFSGVITSAILNLDTLVLAIDAEVSTDLIDKPLLTAEFDGSGGIGGDAAKRGVLKPFGFGQVFNIQPVWFDETRNIGMIDGYGGCLSIDWLGEGLSSFGARVADYATYAALAAAIDSDAIKPGQWGTCVAQGLVGLGAPPVAPIGVHASFLANRTGSAMRRIMEVMGGVPVGRIDTSAFSAIDTTVDRAVHYWTSEQRQIRDLLEALAGAVNATPLVTFQGRITVTRATGGAVAATLDRSGEQEPRVLDWRIADAPTPYRQMKSRAARPANVLSRAEVRFVDTLEDKGLWNINTVYRAGQIVWLSDKSSWLYTSLTPAAGHFPPAGSGGAFPRSDGYWTEQTGPLGALAQQDVADYLTQVGGVGKPELFATAGENKVYNGDAEQGLAGWINDEAATGTLSLSSSVESIGGAQSFKLTKATVGDGTNMVGRAIQVIPGQKWVFRARVYGSNATSTGLYVRLNVRANPVKPTGGYVTAIERTGVIDVVGNGAIATGVSIKEFVVTIPAGVFWVSPAIYAWTGAPLILVVDDVFLGQQTDYANVGGSTRPDDNATRNNPAGVYSGSASYSRGDLVQTPDGTKTYIAKQNVPAGTLLTNTAYFDLFVQGTGGAAGANAFQASLTNPLISIVTAPDGSGGDYSGANGDMRLWEGSINRSTASSYSIVGSVPWASIHPTTGHYVITDPGVDQAQVQFDVSYASVTYRLTLYVVKNKRGTAGTDGFFVETGIRFFGINVFPSGAADPVRWSGGSGTIRLIKGGARITAGVSYDIENDGNVTGLSLTGDTFTFTDIATDVASFKIKAILDGVTREETISVKRIYDGSPAFEASDDIGISSQVVYNASPVNMGGFTTTIPGNRTVRLSAAVGYSPPDFPPPPPGYLAWTGRIHLYYQNLTTGGSPTLLVSSTNGTLASKERTGDAGEPGPVNIVNGSASASDEFTSATTDCLYQFWVTIDSNGVTNSSGPVTAGGTLTSEVIA